jgi:hypothetical protein
MRLSEELEQIIANTAERAKHLLKDEDRKNDSAVAFVQLIHDASRMQNDAQIFTRPAGGEWAYSPSLAEALLIPTARDDYYFDKALCVFASIMLDLTATIPDPHLRSYICGRLNGAIPAPSRDKRSSRNLYRDSIIATLVPESEAPF